MVLEMVLLLTAALAVSEVLLLWIRPLLANKCTWCLCTPNSDAEMVGSMWAGHSRTRLTQVTGHDSRRVSNMTGQGGREQQHKLTC